MAKRPALVRTDDSLGGAAALMEALRIGGFPVVEGERLVGILTSRDVRNAHPNRLVADVMSRGVVTVTPESSLWRAKALMEEHGIERLVVVEGDRPVGVVTKMHVQTELGKYKDALTGLDRAMLFKRRAAEMLRTGSEITVVFMDLDNFGAIDKELGHVRGDEVLQRVGQALRDAIDPDSDHLCRYGGDEFAVVTTRPLEDARRLAVSMLESIEELTVPGGPRVTASAGLAGGRRVDCRPVGEESDVVSNLINMASLASTRAKKQKESLLMAEQANIQVKSPQLVRKPYN